MTSYFWRFAEDDSFIAQDDKLFLGASLRMTVLLLRMTSYFGRFAQDDKLFLGARAE
jgi:hypothetical protein